MNKARIDQLIKIVRDKQIPQVIDAVYRLAPIETAAPKRGHGNCERVAEWLGLHPSLGIYLLFAFDKKNMMHENQTMTVERTLKMLHRLKVKEEIYYDA